MSPFDNAEIEISEERLQRIGIVLLAAVIFFAAIGAFSSPRDENGKPVLLLPDVKAFEDYRRSSSFFRRAHPPHGEPRCIQIIQSCFRQLIVNAGSGRGDFGLIDLLRQVHRPLEHLLRLPGAGKQIARCLFTQHPGDFGIE